MLYVLPAVLLLFSLAFVIVWAIDQLRGYLLWCALCFFCIGIAMLAQLVDIPADDGQNTMLTATIYVLGAFAGGQGILRRSGLRLPVWFGLVSLALIFGGIVFFLYPYPSLLGRVYVLNFGLACMILAYVWYLRGLVRGSQADKLILGMLFLVAIHIFVRTSLTAHSIVGNDTEVDFAYTPFWQWTVFSTAVASVIAGLVLFAAAGADRFSELVHERDSDPLTGLLNRRGLETRMSALGRHDLSGWIVACDIDYFKTINDVYGHATGDVVLKEFAEILQAHSRARNLTARIGGEEFIIFIDDMPADEAFALVEHIREGVKTREFSRLAKGANISCSFGVVRLNSKDDFWQAVERADKVLYTAKEAGRDRTLFEERGA
ncbi:GGDEF domain-containing protein [Brucella sp. NBRC 12950]|jgi:diguanylate cyclase (GGDEF)-like protein|uniref:GGDEF domain-containing protein n=1 Tax=Brucella sp. NBRC 12950 TaxID=2994518 RepID=UPI0024A046DA|nr:GGDEF domain-containing protein [Brucella sp. NBRC 12950]GLU26247.1 GGDEF domain-containing protein [Brucella sp. NBRC 12950]